LFSSFQCAYNKHHSTETTLLSIPDHIKAMSHQQVTCPTLLDLSAAVKTTDHSILLERLLSGLAFISLLSLLDEILFTKPFFVRQY